MNKATINKSRRTMPLQTSQRSVSKVKATDITAHVASDPSLCVDLTSTFRQDSLLIAKRRQQTVPLNVRVDPPAEDSSPFNQEEEEEKEEEEEEKEFMELCNY